MNAHTIAFDISSIFVKYVTANDNIDMHGQCEFK